MGVPLFPSVNKVGLSAISLFCQKTEDAAAIPNADLLNKGDNSKMHKIIKE